MTSPAAPRHTPATTTWRRVEWPSLLLCLAAAVLLVWALAVLLAGGVEDAGFALAFGGLILAGEVFRITYPAGRIQAPLASAGGLSYALVCSLTEKSAAQHVAQAVAVATLGMVVGALPHVFAGRPVGAANIARRVLAVALTAAIYCSVPAAGDTTAGRQADAMLQALVMVAVLVLVTVLNWLVRAASTLRRTSGTLWQHVIVEAKVAPGIEVSVIATAVTLAIATLVTNSLWAVPLFSIPLLLTQSSYRHFAAARRTYAQTIDALSKATELAGFTTVGHARRVADLAVRLGRMLGLGPHELTDLEYAALLHDLGQMVLTEPLPRGATTNLPADERTRIAAAGAALIEEARLPGRVSQIVGRQAEAYGATSEGTLPPRAARIIAVANAYDDLTRGQAAAPAVSRIALQEILDAAGADFDPQVVDALMRLVAPSTATSTAAQSPVAARD